VSLVGDAERSDESASDWRRRYDESLRREADRIDGEEDPETSRYAVFVIAIVAIPFAVAGAYLTPFWGSSHPSVLDRLGNSAVLGLLVGLGTTRLLVCLSDR